MKLILQNAEFDTANDLSQLLGNSFAIVAEFRA